MRQVVLDTETTGIGAENGHRVIEIGCVEIINRRLTNRHFHTYLNPQREIDEGAFRVHGISTEFLQDKPMFKDVMSELLAFVEGAEVIIHNAPFDVGFLNAELKRTNYDRLFQHHCEVFDTLVLAREKHPGLRNNLDALCKRYNIDNTNRELHGALLDAEILAWVYLAMTGGQTELFSDEGMATVQENNVSQPIALTSNSPIILANPEELMSHELFVEQLVKKSRVNLFLESMDS